MASQGTSRSGRKIKPSFKRKANELGEKSNGKAVSKKTKKRGSANSPGSSTPVATDQLPDSPTGDNQTPAMSSTTVQPSSDQPDVINLDDTTNDKPVEDDQAAKLG